jgi:hypothetical protein
MDKPLPVKVTYQTILEIAKKSRTVRGVRSQNPGVGSQEDLGEATSNRTGAALERGPETSRYLSRRVA